MRVGAAVKIRECDSIPGVVGESAEVVELQIQEYEKYRVYPVWARMTSGERRGKIYGFQESEVETLSKGVEAQDVSKERRGRVVKTKVIAQVEGILRAVTTAEEVDEIEKLISEVKGKILLEPGEGFWEGKTPCWEMFHCPDELRDECPAFKYRTLPCWEIEGTYCKLYDYGAKGDGTDICRYCRVYKRWGQGEPVELKLFGKGFNPAG